MYRERAAERGVNRMLRPTRATLRTASAAAAQAIGGDSNQMKSGQHNNGALVFW
jgi:hypothetical protein